MDKKEVKEIKKGGCGCGGFPTGGCGDNKPAVKGGAVKRKTTKKSGKKVAKKTVKKTARKAKTKSKK